MKFQEHQHNFTIHSLPVTATNAGGSDSTTVTIEVNDVPPSLIVYNPSAFTLSKDSPMNAVTPTNNGGDIETWTVSPALPLGLLDSSTGEISGTPTAVTAYATYTITGTNTGSATTTITIIVNDAAPKDIEYSVARSHTPRYAITPVTPTANGGAVTLWSISPTLSPGLIFDTATGEISGTPTSITTATTYTVTAINAGGSGTGDVTITVNDVAPSSISYTPSFPSLAKNSTISPATPTNQGGVITHYKLIHHCHQDLYWIHRLV